MSVSSSMRIDHVRRRLTGLLGGAGMLPALPGLTVAAEAPPALARLGVVLPRSAQHPALIPDFLRGLHAGLVRTGVAVPASELAEYDGARPQSGPAQARSVLARGDVTLLVGVLQPDAARQLLPALRARACPLLACDLGANVARAGGEDLWLAFQTLGAWQAEHAAGIDAVRRLGHRALLAAGWRESGYDLPYAFEHGFTHAGGTMASGLIGSGGDRAADFNALAARVRASRPDFVRALYSGNDATDFEDRYHAAGLHRIAALSRGAFFPGAGARPFEQLGQLAGIRVGKALGAASAGAALATRLQDAPPTLDAVARRCAANLAGRPRSGWLYSYLSA